ncbi:MAG: PH domain-containing protein [Micrococcales bacterium]|nr:PH domain-containing protein [Micrococcales bacterium]
MSQPAAEQTIQADDSDWRRLDRRMLLIHPIQTLIRALPALLAIFLVRTGSDNSDRWELFILPLIVAYGFARWFTTRYRISETQIELRHGVITKQTTTARLDKVRTVDLTAQVWHRMLGLAKVEISTAGTKDRLVLDALSLEAGRRLRTELLHRAEGTVPDSRAAPAPTAQSPVDRAWPAPHGPPVVATGARDEELLRLELPWVRYAPLTMSGFVSAAALLGVGSQLANQLSDQGEIYETAFTWAIGRGLLLGAVLLLLAVTALAIGGYLLAFWNFRLTRNPLGSLHTTRGLLTTRETSIDSSRLRGVEIGEPLGLRLARGGRLKSVTTGLGREARGGTDVLSPPAPSARVQTLALDITGDGAAVRDPLVPHGPAARQRRHTRALAPAGIVAVGWAAMVLSFDWPWGWLLVSVLVLLGALALARSRAAALGHLLTDRHVVVQSGSLDRSRVVLDRGGVVGWTVRQSLFQRRMGVATLIVTTGAGRQHYEAIDLTPAAAYALIGEIHPDLLAQFPTP